MALGLAFSTAAQAAELDELLALPMDSLAGLSVRVAGASRYAQDQRDLPQPVTVLTASDIHAFGYRTLADAVAALPGLHTSGDHIYTYLGARGMIASGNFNSRVLVTVDGYRMNDNIYQQVGLVGREFFLDIDLVDRIEFVPGPGSVLYGNNAFLGVINIVTRAAASRSAVAVATGSGDDRQGRATLSLPLGAGHALLSVTGHDMAGFDRDYPGFGTAHDMDLDRGTKLFAKYEGGPLTVDLIHSDRYKRVPNMVSETELNNPGTWYQDIWDLADLRYRFTDRPDLTLLGRLSWGHYRFNGEYGYSDPTWNWREGSDGRWWGMEATAVWRGIPGHTVVGGLEFQDNYRQWLYSAPIGGAALIDATRDTRTWGAYLEDRFDPWRDTTVNLGLRADRDMSGRMNLSPRLALIHRPGEHDTWRFNLARAYLSPSDYELHYGTTYPSDIGLIPNPNLVPETVMGADLSWERRDARLGRLVLSTFLYRADNLIELSGAYPEERHENRGQATGRGIQAEWQRAIGAGWHLSASATLLQVTDADGWRVDSPRQLAKLNLSGPILFGLRAGVEARYMGPRLDRERNELAAHTLANLTLTGKFGRDITWQAAVFNLFDSRYSSPVSADFPMTAVGQDGRAWRLKLEWAFQ